MQVELLEWNFWHDAELYSTSGRAFRVGPGSSL